MCAITVRMPEELWDAVNVEAEQSGLRAGELVRQAVTVHLAFLAAVRVSNEEPNLRLLFEQMLKQAVARDD